MDILSLETTLHATPEPPSLAPLSSPMPTVGSFVQSTMARVLARSRRDERPIPLPWPELTQIYRGGLWPGMHLLVAGTGAGKSQWALQVALHAAQEKFQVGYIGLELDALQITLRLASLLDKTVPWSDWYVGCRDDCGKVNQAQLDRLPLALERLQNSSIRLDFAKPHGWPGSRLAEVAQEVRAQEPDPTQPILLVLDFLQLVGEEIDPSRRRMELRERIGRAAYFARAVAIEYNAVVLIISSTARDNYMSGEMLAALARADTDTGHLQNPDAIVGLGKESGELEFSADSVAVLARMSSVEIEHGRPIFFAIPKVRAGRARFASLSFNGHRFERINEQSNKFGDQSKVAAAITRAVKMGAENIKKGKSAPSAPEQKPIQHLFPRRTHLPLDEDDG